jgi:hypothetical protein
MVPMAPPATYSAWPKPSSGGSNESRRVHHEAEAQHQQRHPHHERADQDDGREVHPHAVPPPGPPPERQHEPHEAARYLEQPARAARHDDGVEHIAQCGPRQHEADDAFEGAREHRPIVDERGQRRRLCRRDQLLREDTTMPPTISTNAIA